MCVCVCAFPCNQSTQQSALSLVHSPSEGGGGGSFGQKVGRPEVAQSCFEHSVDLEYCWNVSIIQPPAYSGQISGNVGGVCQEIFCSFRGTYNSRDFT